MDSVRPELVEGPLELVSALRQAQCERHDGTESLTGGLHLLERSHDRGA